MARHGIGFKRVHDLHHVAALGLERRIAALPCISTIKEQGVVGTLSPDVLEDRRNSVDAAKLAIFPGQGNKSVRRKRIGLG